MCTAAAATSTRTSFEVLAYVDGALWLAIGGFVDVTRLERVTITNPTAMRLGRVGGKG